VWLVAVAGLLAPAPWLAGNLLLAPPAPPEGPIAMKRSNACSHSSCDVNGIEPVDEDCWLTHRGHVSQHAGIRESILFVAQNRPPSELPGRHRERDFFFFSMALFPCTQKISRATLAVVRVFCFFLFFWF